MDKYQLTIIIEQIIYDNDVVAVYPFGSRVYNTNSLESDYDFVMVIKSEPESDHKEINLFGTCLDFNVYSLKTFKKMIEEHDICALECLSTPEEIRFFDRKEIELPLINLSTLRKSISSVCNNSWVKCKKKLTVEKDEEYIGKKSLYHSFRIIKFGIQLAIYGKIVDFSECNRQFYKEILESPNDWEYLKQRYKEEHNNLMSQFRKLAPKG